ncbi:reverse transcriptase domain-containing protein [Artemisia annua]|uniref:Reverse transcriptase domain-containing protein n=1 Tax=Artemisia annua TaxID=35608 RepID=A0A2U1N899_ARTAN|nr:reverse transcriptase domain-containing protein [Artemisia annua]
MLSMTWGEFKTLFLDEFALEAEVAGLREEFLKTKQGNRTVNKFHAWVIDRVQFCSEYAKSVKMLNEHFIVCWSRKFVNTSTWCKLNLLKSTFHYNKIPVKVLFNSGANRSFVASRFVPLLAKPMSKLKFPVEVEVDGDNKYILDDVNRNSDKEMASHKFSSNLIPMELGEFDITVGMDWLGQHNANIVCKDKSVHLVAPNGESLIIFGERRKESLPICSFARAKRYPSRGYLA